MLVFAPSDGKGKTRVFKHKWDNVDVPGINIREHVVEQDGDGVELPGSQNMREHPPAKTGQGKKTVICARCLTGRIFTTLGPKGKLAIKPDLIRQPPNHLVNLGLY